MTMQRRTQSTFVGGVGVALAAGALTACGGATESGQSSEATEETGQTAQAVTTTFAEYKFPAAVLTDVLSDRKTELWARVYFPSTLGATTKYPLLVFLHGNHETCGTGSNPRVDDNSQYTDTGTCPPGYVVVPSHAGYDYIATDLASHNYIVVSINTDRGINAAAGIAGDDGLNLARGRMVLEHLKKLSRWNRGLEATPSSLHINLKGHLDFGNVGLMGHSRGGEGVRAAYAQYHDSGSPWPTRIPDHVTVRGIFEIAPVDGQTSRVLNALNTRWGVLLPMCDGDVSDLEGIKPFDRMITATGENPESFKATVTVWGACHNYYNTQWQQGDSDPSLCLNNDPLFAPNGPGVVGSASQQNTGLITLDNFFRGSVGATSATYRHFFNPLFPVPDTFNTRADRGFVPAPATNTSSHTRLIEDFGHNAPFSRYGFVNASAPNVTEAHTQLPEHDPLLSGGVISWTNASPSTTWTNIYANPGSGISISGFNTLDIRLDRADDPLNTDLSTDFEISLVNANNSLSSSVLASSYVSIVGPIGGPGGTHTMLQTARIPLTKFTGATLTAIRGVQFRFAETLTGKIYVADITASATTDDVGGLALVASAAPAPAFAPRTAMAPITPLQVTAGNGVVGVRPALATVGAGPGAMEIELTSSVPFRSRDALLVLHVGATDVTLSRFSDPSAKSVVFTFTPAQYAAVQNGDPVRVDYGRNSNIQWHFGPLTKP
jgi:hypothetical protein